MYRAVRISNSVNSLSDQGILWAENGTLEKYRAYGQSKAHMLCTAIILKICLNYYFFSGKIMALHHHYVSAVYLILLILFLTKAFFEQRMAHWKKRKHF